MKRWHFWVGLLISVLFLFIALHGLQLIDVWEGIKSADFIWLFPGIIIYFIAVWMRAFRWHLFLRPVKIIPVNEIFPVVTIGYMGNNIYPARAGEILRAIVLKHQHKVPVSASFATIVIEYNPDKKLVESKSLKLYLFAYRNEGMFHEFVVNKIAHDLFELLDPLWIMVRGEFMPRGGISIHPITTIGKNSLIEDGNLK